MATTAQSPNDLTRQQLDELDDLLQRMLSLPLNPPESFENSPPARAFASPLPTPAPAPVVREVPARCRYRRLRHRESSHREHPSRSSRPVPWKSANA